MKGPEYVNFMVNEKYGDFVCDFLNELKIKEEKSSNGKMN